MGQMFHPPQKGVDCTTCGLGANSPAPLRAITKVNGVNFFSGGSPIGTSPTISWSAPKVGTPGIYGIQVHELFINPATPRRTRRRTVANVITPDLSFKFPPGLLAAGKSYAFTVSATMATSAASATSIANAPFRSTIDTASARVTSAIFTP